MCENHSLLMLKNAIKSILSVFQAENLSPLLFGSFCESGTGRGALWSSLNQRDRLSPALILLFLLLLIPVQYLTTTDKYKIKYQDTNANTRYSSPLILLSLHPLILVHLPYLAYVLVFLNLLSTG